MTDWKEKRLNEGFQRYTDHQCATDGLEFLRAAEMLEDGRSVAEVFAKLSPQARTTLFHVESRPGLPMLLDRGREKAAEILRECAGDLDQ